MTDTELNELETLARAATPGPWLEDKVYPNHELYVVSTSVNGPHITFAEGVDGKFVAKANPSAIIDLIRALRQAWAERDSLAGKLASLCNEQDSLVYSAEGEYCAMCNGKCPFPYIECSNITPEMWLKKAF